MGTDLDCKEVPDYLKTISGPLAVPEGMRDTLLACIVGRNVPTVQVPGLMKAALQHMQTLRERLYVIRRESRSNRIHADTLEQLIAMLETGRDFRFPLLHSGLEELGHGVIEVSPSVRVMVQECRALAAAVMQDHLKAADICAQTVRAQGVTESQRWKLLHLQATWLGEHGREFDDDSSLRASLEFLRSDVIPTARETGDPDKEAMSHALLGSMLGVIGQRRMGTRYLEEAIEALQTALELCSDPSRSDEWAAFQNSLGNALGTLGQRQADDTLLTQAVEAFEKSLEVRTEEHRPDEWASTMNNLGAVLQSLGQRKKDPKILKRAVESYKAVLRVWTRTGVPLDWATTMHNLGTALRSLGEHRRGPRTLEQAVAAYHSALSVRTREHLPEEWAMTQNNLGTALQKLAVREESAATMQRATEAYENTLTVWTRDRAPMTWAMTMANLGVARRECASLSGDIETADRAVEEIRSAVEVFRGASHAQYTELGEEQLSFARQLREKLIEEAGSEQEESVRIAFPVDG